MSLSVVWAMLELVSNPRVAEKLRNELDAVVGRANAVDFELW
jgi:cytochrome P450